MVINSDKIIEKTIDIKYHRIEFFGIFIRSTIGHYVNFPTKESYEIIMLRLCQKKNYS